MLKLYYTTTKGEDEIQSKSFNSLGGYRSSSPVKNDEFDNIFGEISNYTLSQNNQAQYIAIILRNEGTVKTNVNSWFEYLEDSYSKLEIAAVDLSTDSEGFKFMENIPNMHSSPIYAEFFEANGEINKVDLGDLAQDEMIGIWLKRTILVSVASQDREELVVEDPENSDRVVQKELSKSDTIELKFSYD